MNNYTCLPAPACNSGLNIGADGKVYNGDVYTGYSFSNTPCPPCPPCPPTPGTCKCPKVSIGRLKEEHILPQTPIPMSVIENYNDMDLTLSECGCTIHFPTAGVYSIQFYYTNASTTYCEITKPDSTVITTKLAQHPTPTVVHIEASSKVQIIGKISIPEVKIKEYEIVVYIEKIT